MCKRNFFPHPAALRWLHWILALLLVLQLPTRAYAQTISPVLTAQSSEIIGGRGSGITNILLVGQDRREGENRARSDSMILCTYRKETGSLVMTSFLRDLYVPIPGYSDNRINAAYAFGGMDLLKKTLEENFSLHIDGGIEVDFSQFADIIDLMGGVELELRQDEADFINKETGSTLQEGSQLLNGPQTLIYSRIRSLDGDGDFSRTGRQRKVLNAMMDICRNAGIPKLMKLMDQLTDLVTTDMSKGKLLGIALDLVPDLSSLEVTSQHVPAPGTYRDRNIQGMAVLEADIRAVRDMLRRTLTKESAS